LALKFAVQFRHRLDACPQMAETLDKLIQAEVTPLPGKGFVSPYELLDFTYRQLVSHHLDKQNHPLYNTRTSQTALVTFRQDADALWRA
jgi:hypothetical protein